MTESLEQHLPGWHPDPHQPPVATRQWAEAARLLATSLRQEGRQAPEEAVLVHQARELHVFLNRLDNQHPGSFIRVSPATLAPPGARLAP